MEVSVIVVNYNGGEIVKKCLESIFRQRATFSYEAIVVDNGSSDGSREEIISQFPQVRLIANKTNFGFSRANNQAILRSSSTYILLLNNDAYLKEEDSLEKAVAFMERRREAGAIGPEIINPEGKVQNPYYKGYPNLATEFLSLAGLLPVYNFLTGEGYFYTPHGLAFYRKDLKEISVSHLCGACMLLRGQALEEVGLLDERMFFYREDLDLSFRLRKKGWKIFILPYLTAVHAGARSWEKVPFSIGGEATKSIYFFFKKNYGEWQYQLLRLIHLGTVFPRLLVHPILRFLGKSTPKARAYYRSIFEASLNGLER